MRVAAALASMLAIAGCRCEPAPTTVTTQGTLRVTPAALDFGGVPSGATMTLAVSLENTGASPVDATLSVALPFGVAGALTVPGGSSTSVLVTFAPNAPGTFAATLTVTSDFGSSPVMLTGTGGPPCTVSVCHAVHFDAATRACVETALDDDTACTSACLTGATCHGGACVGSSIDCNDGDPCTIDGCSADMGCMHSPRECPVSDCNATVCSSDGGCGQSPLDDGTPCGAQDCSTAHVCIAGACQQRARPGVDADLDCKYTSLAAGNGFTCGLTRRGTVRCWGALKSGYGVILPDAWPATGSRPIQVAGLNDVTTLAASEVWLCAGLDSGTLWCNSGPPDAGLGGRPKRVAINGGGYRFAITEDGELSVWTLDGSQMAVPWPFTDVRDVAATDAICLLYGDGGTFCNQGSLPGDVVRLESNGVWVVAILDGGAAVATPSTVLASSGVSSVGGIGVYDGLQRNLVCLGGDDAGVACSSLGGPSYDFNFPAGVTQLTAKGWTHLCALDPAGDAWCVGSNVDGELGDTSARPASVVQTAMGVRSAVTVSQATLALSGETLLGWGAHLISLAGDPLPGDGGVLAGGSLGALPGLTDVLDAAHALTDAGTLLCWGRGHPVAPVRSFDGGVLTARRCNPATDVVSGPGPCIVDAAGTYVALAPLCTYADVPPGCTLERDGGVHCWGFDGHANTIDAPVPLAAPARSLSVLYADPVLRSGCALLVNGTLQCWTFDLSQSGAPSFTVATPPGTPPVARQVIGGLSNGCTLSGLNAVACWGGNYYGQLGRDGPWSPSAVAVSMPEAVVELIGSGPQFALSDDVPPQATEELSQVCARLASGRLLCWGDNSSGQLGPVLQASQVPRRVAE